MTRALSEKGERNDFHWHTQHPNAVWIIYFNDTVLMSFRRGGGKAIRDGDEISKFDLIFLGKFAFSSSRISARQKCSAICDGIRSRRT